MAMDESSFLDQIAAAPRDVDQRKVYADWLEERHDPRAAVLRAQIHAIEARTGPPEARRAAMRAACADIDPSWLAQIDLAPIENCVHPPDLPSPCPGRWEALPREPLATQTRRCPVCAASVRYHTAPPEALDFGDPVAILSAAERRPGDLNILVLPPTNPPPPQIYSNPAVPYPPLDPTDRPHTPLPPPPPEAPEASAPADATPRRWWQFWRRSD